MIKNMIDSRRVLGADATTDTEGVARRQAVSGSIQSQDYGRPQPYLNSLSAAGRNKGFSPFTLLSTTYENTEGRKVAVYGCGEGFAYGLRPATPSA